VDALLTRTLPFFDWLGGPANFALTALCELRLDGIAGKQILEVFRAIGHSGSFQGPRDTKLPVGDCGFLEVGFLEVSILEVGSVEIGSSEVGSVENGSLEICFMEIEASTVFLGYASLSVSEHIQDRLDVSGRTAWLRRSNLLRPFIRVGGSFVRRRGRVRGPREGFRSFRSVLPNVSRKNFHNRAVVPLWRVPSDPFESVDATEAYL
jgi:hypothetical protein